MLDKFIGSDFVKQNIKTALEANRLSNSILICAEDGLGRGLFSRLLAADFLYPQGGNQAQAVLENISPEVLTVTGTGASGQISVEAIRQVRQEICETSLSATGRVVIIKDAHMLNQSSANAVLKILEEPPQGVLFILTAKNPQTVLATIRSRCGIYSLCTPTIEQCEQYLATKTKDIKNVQLLSAVFDGKIGVCLQCLQDKKKMQSFETALKVLDCVSKKNEYQLLCLFAKYEKEKQQVIEILQFAYQAVSAVISGKVNEIPKIDVQSASKTAQALQQTLVLIRQNVNLKLCLTGLATQIC